MQGEVQALFLRHEGYLGAIGAFLKGAEQDSEWGARARGSWAQVRDGRGRAAAGGSLRVWPPLLTWWPAWHKVALPRPICAGWDPASPWL